MALLTAISAISMAQGQSTYFGRTYDAAHGNGIYVDASKVSTQFPIAFTVSGGDGGYTAYGLEIGLYRQYKIGGWGFNVGSEYSKEYGASNSAFIVGGLKWSLTEHLSLVGKGLLGMSQAHETIESMTKAGSTHTYDVGYWRPSAAIQAELAGEWQNFRLSVFGRYGHKFFAKNQHSLDLGEEWTEVSRTNDVNRWTVGVTVAHVLRRNSQASGDNRWEMELLGGSGNLGGSLELRAIHYKRATRSPYYARLLGLGTSLLFSEGDVLHQLGGIAGIRVQPWKADGLVDFDIYSDLSIGQFGVQKSQGATASGSFRMYSNVHSFGGSLSLNADVLFHINRWHFGGGGSIGGWITPGITAEGAGYSADKANTSGIRYKWQVKVAYSLGRGAKKSSK